MIPETLAQDLDAAYGLRNWPRMSALSRKGLLGEPGRPEAWMMLAIVAANDGRTGDARLGFARAAAVLPDWADAWANLGRIDASSPATASRAFRRSLALAPGNVTLLGTLALRLLDLGDAAGAARLLRRGHAFAPDACDICVNLGLALVRLEDGSAAGWFAAAIALAPQELAGHLNLGQRLLAEGDVEQAQNVAQRVLALDPASVEAIRLDAALLRAAGRLDDAARRLASIRNAAPQIDAQLALVRLGQRRLADAYEVLTDAYRRDPRCLPELREVLAGASTGELWLSADGLKRKLGG